MSCNQVFLLKNRVYIEKLPHARCLGFIKVPADLQGCQYITDNMAKVKLKLSKVVDWTLPESDEDLIFIPQDETTRQKVLKDEERTNEIPETFDEGQQVSYVNFLEDFADL